MQLKGSWALSIGGDGFEYFLGHLQESTEISY